MKTNTIKFTAVFLCLLCFVFSINAQKRRTSTRKTKAQVETTAPSNFEIKAGAEKVSTQIKNVSKFIYSLGGIARIIEDLDKEIAERKASRNAPELNAKIKQDVMASIRNLRAGLAALEVEFRTKNGLKIYVAQIQGISDMAGVAEDQASGGQFTESGKTFLMVIEKLSNTLASLP